MMLNALDAPRRQLPEIDYALLWSVLLLLFTGMVMVYSASIAIAEAGRMTGHQPTYYLIRHAIFLAIGMASPPASPFRFRCRSGNATHPRSS